MSRAGIGAYRRDVVATTDCPDCHQNKGEPCTRIVAGRAGDTEMSYVHDVRCYRHHVDTLFRQFGTVNPY